MTEVCLFLIASGLDLGAEREIMKTKSDSSILDEPRRGPFNAASFSCRTLRQRLDLRAF